MTLLGWGGGANRASAGVESCSLAGVGWMAIGGDGGNCFFWKEVGDQCSPPLVCFAARMGRCSSITRRLDLIV